MAPRGLAEEARPRPSHASPPTPITHFKGGRRCLILFFCTVSSKEIGLARRGGRRVGRRCVPRAKTLLLPPLVLAPGQDRRRHACTTATDLSAVGKESPRGPGAAGAHFLEGQGGNGNTRVFLPKCIWTARLLGAITRKEETTRRRFSPCSTDSACFYACCFVLVIPIPGPLPRPSREHLSETARRTSPPCPPCWRGSGAAGFLL